MIHRYALALAGSLLAAGTAYAEDNAPAVAGASDPQSLLWVESPCPGPECNASTLQPAHAQGLRVVYLVFDGITLSRGFGNDDATSNTSGLVNSSTEFVPAFDPGDLSSDGGLTRQQIIDRVISDLYVLHQPYNIEFTTTRPSAGSYSMVVFGGTCESVVGRECAGIALRDCGDVNPNNITFAFPPGLRVSDLATTAAQEAAHAWGLGHTDDDNDVMFPRIQAKVPTGYGAGMIMGANGQFDGSGCPSSVTYQDSHDKMLTNIGARGPDNTPPTVTITNPSNGGDISPGQLIAANATDNLAVERVALSIDGSLVRELDRTPYEFALSSQVATGLHDISVQAWDISGNTATATGTINVVSGNNVPCSDDTDCLESEHCNGEICVPDGPDPGAGDFTPCTGNDDCDSGLCATVGDQSLCTTSCTTNEDCPANADCLSGTACWPAEGDGGGGGGGPCQAGGSGSGAAGGLLLLAMAAVLRRRRPAS